MVAREESQSQFNLELDLAFVKDERLRRLLQEFWSQSSRAFTANSFLGTLVGCGAILEGVLTWALLQREEIALKSERACRDKQGKILPIPKWNLTNLVEVASELKLIGKNANQASWAVKEFRNLIGLAP